MPSTPSDPSQPPVSYSIVIPVYRNRDSLPRLLAELERITARLDRVCEVVFVVDGSPDDSIDVLRRLAPEATFPSQIVQHSRNFGSFPAIRTGITAARGDYIGVMAADLQEPPELMLSFFDLLSKDTADVVVGRREGRADPASTALFSRLYWGFYRRAVMPDIPAGGVDVFGINRSVAHELMKLTESSSSLVGLLYWVGFRRVEVPYERQARLEGTSGWTFRKKFNYLTDSVFAFTRLPIRALGVIGVLGTIVVLLVSMFVFVAWATGHIVEPGYTPLMLVILGCTFLLLFAMGVLGSYIWRIFQNSQARPLSIVANHDSLTGRHVA